MVVRVSLVGLECCYSALKRLVLLCSCQGVLNKFRLLLLLCSCWGVLSGFRKLLCRTKNTGVARVF